MLSNFDRPEPNIRIKSPAKPSLAHWVIVLGVVATFRVLAADVPTSRVDIGASLAAVEFIDGSSVRHSLARGHTTVLLVFDSQCAHCVREAPTWKSWLDANPDVHTLAITAEDHGRGSAFAVEHGWRTDVRRVELGLMKRPERDLMARTPWIFVVSGEGVIRASLYGGQIDDVARFLSQ